MSGSDTLSQQLTIRLSSGDLRRLDGIVDLEPDFKRNAVARRAMRLGMETLEEDPARLLSGSDGNSQRKKRNRR